MSQMVKLERSHLLNFLSKPRFASEIAERFNVPIRLVDSHLQDIVRSGQVLVSETPVPQTLLAKNGKLEESEGVLYLAQDSPFLSGEMLKLNVQEVEKTPLLSPEVASIKFSRISQSSAKEISPKREEQNNLPSFSKTSSKSKTSIVSRFFGTFIRKGFSSKQVSWKHDIGHRSLPDHSIYSGEGRSLSHPIRLRLFQALLNQPLTFLDIHGRFKVSKQTIMGFVRKGLLKEEWGQGGIGVKYGLTKKGKTYVRQIESAVRLKSYSWKNPFIRLKHKISS